MTGPPVSIEVEGAKELRSILRQIGDKDLKTGLRLANKTVSQLVVDEALPNVPVRTGRLRQSVKALATQSAAYGKAGSGRVPYAAAIHWGEGTGNVNYSTGATVGRAARNIRGRPFLWDAADKVINRAVTTYEDAIQDLFDKAVR